MVTRDAAAMLGRDDIGVLERGRAGDLVVYRLDRIGYAGTHDPLAALLLAGDDTRVDYSVINGQVIVSDGKLLSMSEDTIVEAGNAAARTLMATAPQKK